MSLVASSVTGRLSAGSATAASSIAAAPPLPIAGDAAEQRVIGFAPGDDLGRGGGIVAEQPRVEERLPAGGGVVAGGCVRGHGAIGVREGADDALRIERDRVAGEGVWDGFGLRVWGRRRGMYAGLGFVGQV